MITAVESYLAVRRASAFTLSNTEYLLRSFSAFAANKRQTYVRTAITIDWACQARSVAQRHTRYQTVCRFAQYLRVEDPRHESPPPNHFGYRKTRHVPLFARRDRRPCPRCDETFIVRPVTAQDVCGPDQSVGSDRSANLRSFASVGERHHIRRFARPQNQVSENPIGAFARHRRDGPRSLLEAPSRNAMQWRPCLRFG